MGLFDKLRGKATEVVDQHGDKISGGIDKAAAAVDKKTKGKYAGQVGTGRAKAKEALDKLDGKRDGDVP